MGRIKGEVYLLFGGLILFVACETRKLDYPDIIQQHDLEALYDQAIKDWHILNSTGAFSEARYLLREDTLIPSPEWIPSIDSMQKYYPGRSCDGGLVALNSDYNFIGIVIKFNREGDGLLWSSVLLNDELSLLN